MKREKGIVARALKKRPNIPRELQFYLTGFWTLDRGREIGMNGPSALSLQAMQLYLNGLILSWDEQQSIIRIWQRMDAKYLEVAAQKRKIKRASK